jgi:integrase
LYLVVHQTGTKSWVLRYHSPLSGRTVKLTLGPADFSSNEVEGEPVLGAPLSLAAARQLTATLKRAIAMGKDPAAEKRQERINASDYTFADAAKDYVEHAVAKDHRQWRDKAALLGLKPDADGKLKPTKGGLCERWRDKPLATLTEDDMFAVIDETRLRGAPGLERRVKAASDPRARAMHSALSAFFNWAKGRRKVKTNPVEGLSRPKPAKARERILTDYEIRKFWAATENLMPAFRNSLRLMLLTGQRRDEVAGMRRSELSADLTIWTIPGSRTKNRREHQVLVPPLARQIIASTESISKDLIFTTTGDKSICGWTKVKRKLDDLMGEDVPHWTFHDLRRSAVSGMARAGADLHVIERAVNHTSGSFGGIVSVYQKHKFADEVKAALEAWENLVLSIVEGRPANVTPIRRKG